MQYIIIKESTNQIVASIDTETPEVVLADGYDIKIVESDKSE